MKWDMVERLESKRLIDEFEELCEYKFPKSFRKCVIKNNGGTPNACIFDTDVEEEREIDCLFSFNREGEGLTIWEVYENCESELALAIEAGDVDEINANKFLLDRFVMFADTPFGDSIAFDKTDDSVVYINHETFEVEHIADSFDEFLDCLYDDDDDDDDEYF